MRKCAWPALAIGALWIVAQVRSETRPANAPALKEARWHKYVLDTKFRSEGAAAGDVNHDGRMDVFAGCYWYEAPSWAPHEITAAKEFDGAGGYSDSFMNYAADLNKDGWIDQIVIGFPGDKATWRENPKNQPGHWKEHLITKTACNESAQFVDLLGNKKPVLLCGVDEKRLCWFEPGPDVTQEWVKHEISVDGQPGAQRFSHGLGIGDIDGDKKADVLTADGFYLQPADPRSTPWKFVPAKLGGACAHMYTYDVNKDGLPDIVCSAAHAIGVWWFEQKKGANGMEFVQHVIDDRISQTHSMMMVSVDGSKTPGFVTGKRWWAHGPKGDVNPDHPAMLVWYKPVKSKDTITWERFEIDNDSGVGTQFCIADMNKDGKPDVVTSNKKGVYVFVQE